MNRCQRCDRMVSTYRSSAVCLPALAVALARQPLTLIELSFGVEERTKALVSESTNPKPIAWLSTVGSGPTIACKVSRSCQADVTRGQTSGFWRLGLRCVVVGVGGKSKGWWWRRGWRELHATENSARTHLALVRHPLAVILNAVFASVVLPVRPLPAAHPVLPTPLVLVTVLVELRASPCAAAPAPRSQSRDGANKGCRESPCAGVWECMRANRPWWVSVA